MKKIFAFAIAAATMAVGCQKFQDLINPNNEPLDDGTPVPVVFGTNVATISTKAAVETSFSDTDVIHVYGIKTDATDLTAEGVFLLKDYKLTGPIEENNSTDAYYGANKETYSFYGFYTGDATVQDVAYEANKITVPVTIDGDDDVMVGLTDKANDLTNRNENGTTAPVLADLYSAKSSRRGVTPKLVFDHKLVRFDFVFADGSKLQPTGDKSVWVEKVAVKSVAEGNLVITHTEAPTGVLTPKEDVDAINLIAGSDKPEEGAYEWKPLAQFGMGATDDLDEGEAHATIMAMPLAEGATQEYPVTLSLGQTGSTETVDQTLTLAMSGEKKFEAGKKYTVTITVYGLEAVIVNVEVKEWASGGSFSYDPDEDETPKFDEE